MYHTTINVSKDGRHQFRVELGKDGDSDGNIANVAKVFKMLTEAFPDCNVSASRKSIMSGRFNPLHELERGY